MSRNAMDYTETERKLINVVPHKRQISWQETEFYGFIHFGINTFTGKQWGNGNDSPLLFNPTDLDTDQWVKIFKEGGMKGLILTCKHHDGFCLWPSQFTDYSVASSLYKGGRGDIVKETSESCAKYGLKFGIYLSPWDRHDSRYGKGKIYMDYYLSQLTELLSNYGKIFSVWLDGACGERENGKQQTYDWENIYEVVRELQPEACISVCGPDVRWCGNESGKTREQEWSVVSEKLKDAEKVQKESQTDANHQAFIHSYSTGEQDLGSREVLDSESKLIWYPCEVNTSIRPSWFYTSREDVQVKSVKDLLDLYIRSVGGNSTLLLNVPPTKEGKLYHSDAEVLKQLGKYIREAFSDDLVIKVRHLSEPELNKTLNKDKVIYQLEIDLRSGSRIDCIELQEDIRFSQRIEAFEIWALIDSSWVFITESQTIGYKKLITIPDIKTDKIALRVTSCRSIPKLKKVRAYSSGIAI